MRDTPTPLIYPMKLSLAPIRGITDYIYRDAFTHHFGGFDSAIAPFVSSMKGRKVRAAFLKDLLPENNRRLPTIPQILSKNADDFIYTAQQIFDLGYQEINWNLGCPTPMVANKKRGSGLLPYPEKIELFLDKVTQAFPNMVSVKTRLGRHSSAEIFKLMPLFNQFPLKKIIIHPRIGVQMYKGSPDVGCFMECAPLCRHPLVYNGDIVNRQTFIALRQQLPQVDEWMIGRGVLKNPYLALIINEQQCAISRDVLLAFHDELMERYRERLAGPGHLLGRMKGIWNYFAHIFKDERAAMKRVAKSQTIERYADAVNKNFAEEELVFLGYTA